MMQRLTPLVKNLLIINIAVFIFQQVGGAWVTGTFSLWNIESQHFRFFQPITYMFLHGDFMHILFNMFGLVFLGPLLERFWGSKKFLTFYLVTGIGAAVIFGGISFYQNFQMSNEFQAYVQDPNPIDFRDFMIDYSSQQHRIDNAGFLDNYSENPESKNYQEESIRAASQIVEVRKNGGPMLGASGAVYGILMAFGMLFPNTELMLLFPPIPIKAKYLALGLGAIALYKGLNQYEGDNTAHFAHLGGMVFAFILIQYWKKQKDNFY